MEKAASMRLNEVFDALHTSSNGLSSEEAKARLKQYGFNVLVEKKTASLSYRFIIHFKDLFGILLLFAAALAAISQQWELSLIILGVVLLNIFVSLFQESRAEKAMQTLKHWVPEYAKVIRDGELHKIPVKEIVPGDIIILEEGDRVPADARLIEAFDLWTNNVPLTGESEPQPRSAKLPKQVDRTYLDSPNLVFMSTSVARGSGKAVVIATGMSTQFGQIANLTQTIREEDSPLQKEITLMAKYDFVIAVVVGAVFFATSLLWLRVELYTSILFMIGVMVACVPEGLQVTVSSALAINVLKMVRQNVLVKRLSSVQTLGSVTVICTDKTGTITKGEMTVKKLWVKNHIVEVSGIGYDPTGDFTLKGEPLKRKEVGVVEKLLEIAALCNSAKIEPPSDRNAAWSVIGDPTDGALVVAALKYGLNVQDVLAEKPIVDIKPFDFTRKRMTTVHKLNGDVLVCTKGAPRSILTVCKRILVDDREEEFTRANLRVAEARIREFANEGLRVIAIAYKKLPKSEYSKDADVERDMVFVGLAAMRDPPRPEVKEAVTKAKQAGIKTVIITGDYGPTARAIAEEVGIVTHDCCNVIRGADLDSLSDEAIVAAVKMGNVLFARVSPEQKLRIVKVIRDSGEIVAVTGDGANDAPSLKEADIGVAMGVSGTDVAREAADMVLLDDSFESIVKAVESGRAIYENIRKFIVYVFSHNWAELIPYVLYALLGIPLPLLVVQVLAIDLAIDVVPSLALSREPPEVGIMNEPPRSIKERLFTAKVFSRSLFIGVIIAIGAMYGCLSTWMAGGWQLGMSLPSDSPVYLKGVTMTFAGIVVAQAGNVLACRTSKASIFKSRLSANKWIIVGIVAQLSILSFLIYVPYIRPFFGTAPLGFGDWVFLASLAVVVVVVEEIRKFFVRRLSKSS
ncbi:cation-transporting P-type ATPase [Candidatus Bathyarchaeota archaeon A05DMB-2]|nr:cation-transporting P-type ATPase [Candidatus Bathyarchaeota archaeon A05DMB-2]